MPEQNVSGYRWMMLAAGCLAICSIYIDMIAYAPILGEVAKGLHVEMASATNLMMGFVLSVACVLIWGGVVCDKYGITAALVLGLLCSTVPTALLPWIGDSFAAVMAARLVQGASVGFVFAIIGPILALWFPAKEQGIASGLLIGSVSLGSAIGVCASPALLEATGSWTRTIFLLGIPGWAGIILALAGTRKSPPAQAAAGAAEADSTADGGVLEALSYPMTWIGSAIVFCNAWALYCLYNLVPPYLASPAPMGLGLGPGLAGKLSIAVTIVGLLATIVGGAFFDTVAKGNSRPGLVIGFLVSASAALILVPAVSANIIVLTLCLLAAGWGIPFMNPSISAFIAINYSPRVVGRMVGWWFGVGTLGGAAGLYVGGMTIGSSGSFYLAIGLISVVALCGALLSPFLRSGRKAPAVAPQVAAVDAE